MVGAGAGKFSSDPKKSRVWGVHLRLYGTGVGGDYVATVLLYAMGPTPPDVVDSRRDCVF